MNSSAAPVQPCPVIVALDFESRDEALHLVNSLGLQANFYKLGLQMLTVAGPELIRELIGLGKFVFLDLKLHEIPNSVAAAVRAAGKLGASFVTVHASAGSAVLDAAVLAAKSFPNLKVLALTVITSLSDAELPSIGLAPSVREQVLRLVSLAVRADCHGVIASSQEATEIRRQTPVNFLVVTPGIHLSDGPAGDQARAATPFDAGFSGASHIIIGRAISRTASPITSFQHALDAFLEGKRMRLKS